MKRYQDDRLPYPLADSCLSRLPARVRPIVRWRDESLFGLLAAFPDGHLAILDEGARPLLEAGLDYESCAAHLIPEIKVNTRFHFSAPLMVWLELTRACNLRCPHCFAEGGTMRNGELPTSRIFELLEEWARMGVFSVILTGGEPTLHKDFLAIVKHAHALGFVIGVATNGMPLTKPLLEQLPRDDLIISVSIDELHRQGTKDGLSDFQYCAQKIKLIQAAGINAAIMMTTSSTNVASLHPVLDWAIENRVSLRSVPYVPMGRASLYKHLAHRKDDADAVAKFWIAEEEWDRVRDLELGLCAGKVFVFLLAMVFALRRCMSGRGICYVTSNGDLFPCTTCSGNKVLCAGNVAWTPFNEIWRADWDIRDITWDTFEAACKGCTIADRDYFFAPGAARAHRAYCMADSTNAAPLNFRKPVSWLEKPYSSNM